MVYRSGCPSHRRAVRLISVGHNILFLMVFPMLKVLSCYIPVEIIIKFTTKIFTVICLKIDVLDWIFQCLFPILPVFCISSHLIGRRQLYAAENDLLSLIAMELSSLVDHRRIAKGKHLSGFVTDEDEARALLNRAEEEALDLLLGDQQETD